MTKKGWYSLLVLSVVGVFLPILEFETDKQKIILFIIENIVYLMVGFVITKFLVQSRLKLWIQLALWFLPLMLLIPYSIMGYELSEEMLILYMASALLYIYFPDKKEMNLK